MRRADHPGSDLSSEPEPNVARQGSNSSAVRRFNERRLLTWLRRLGEASKADLARHLNLTQNTVGQIVLGLAAQGLVSSRGRRMGQRGQPATLLRLEPGGAYSIGIKLGRRSVDALLVDLTGAVLKSRRYDCLFPEPAQALELAMRGISEIRRSVPKGRRDRLVGVGLALPFNIGTWRSAELDRGLQDGADAGADAGHSQAGADAGHSQAGADAGHSQAGADAGHSQAGADAGHSQAGADAGHSQAGADAPAWLGYDLAAHLQPLLDLPLLVESEGAAVAIAELFHGHGRQLDDFACIYINSSIGGGAVLDGAYRRGVTGNAGDIGLIPVQHSSLPVNRPAGSRSTTLQDRASGSALIRHLQANGITITKAAQLHAVLRDHPGLVDAWLQDCADALVMPMLSMAMVLDVQAIILDGNLPRAIIAALLGRLGPLLQAATPRSRKAPGLLHGSSGDHAAALGAALLPLHDRHGQTGIASVAAA
ncbi:ROK family protein [Lichenicoccus sp.]|uniref:ROK family protein n=1 Tax=Lichenicoccus sp. TaxID=2781899 RepID=UPI003D0FB53A